MESRKGLLVFNAQAFSWASNLNHLDLKGDIWNGTLRTENEKENHPTLSIDQVRGHLTPGLLGKNQRQLQGILERLVGRAKILVDRANTNPQCSQTFQLNPTKNT